MTEEYYCPECFTEMSKRDYLSNIYRTHSDPGVCKWCGTPNDPPEIERPTVDLEPKMDFE